MKAATASRVLARELLREAVRDAKRSARKAKRRARALVWCATFSDRVRHAHVRNGWMHPMRLCSSVLVADPEHWKRTKKQPRARCVTCMAILVDALTDEDGEE